MWWENFREAAAWIVLAQMVLVGFGLVVFAFSGPPFVAPEEFYGDTTGWKDKEK